MDAGIDHGSGIERVRERNGSGRMKSDRNWWRVAADQLGLLTVLVLLVLSFGFTTKHFLTALEFRTIANQIPATVLVTVGMTYVLVIGGIDLSVGSVLGLCGGVIGVLMTGAHPMPLGFAIVAALLGGLVCGAFNGLVSEAWSIPSFVVTLGMLEIARGATHLITSSRSAYIGDRAGALADATLLGLSMPFWIAMATVAIGQFVLTRTVFGRYMIAIGTNEEAVRAFGHSDAPGKNRGVYDRRPAGGGGGGHGCVASAGGKS